MRLKWTETLIKTTKVACMNKTRRKVEKGCGVRKQKDGLGYM